ncbi:chromate efflux transporter [Nocardioides panacisoli]|uniref:chromate efflux transporter n=1 Tax=Nocardioides panacisoli TaxID=627624 RepID=UPI001C632488|nr:chromate efflux transporter [Nocardioides panacisoli]QYJ02467.1 chromate efflux transporter [Nocardioides panacisoli]
MTRPSPAATARSGSAGEVFAVFLGLGLTSFGGPVAHLGYFRDAFVVRRRWLTEHAYADLVALCQFLPGPASSQVGMAIGLQRAGLRGMAAAWVAFTLPSAVALVAFGYALSALDGQTAWIGGLKAAAVAVVAHAVVGMARTLTPDLPRIVLAAAATAGALALSGAGGQVLVIAAAGIVGVLVLRGTPSTEADGEGVHVPVGRRTAVGCLVAFAVGLVALPALAAATASAGLDLADAFYRAGALVFGGGHVVLPLLESGTVQTGLVDREAFLAGYGAAQAVPGPLFTFAAFLGSVAQSGPTGVLGATIALVAIFLPAALLVLGALPFWERLRRAPRARRALQGVNAGVVGLLAAALWTPVIEQGITSPPTLGIAVVAFGALLTGRVPAWAVVIVAGGVGALAL